MKRAHGSWGASEKTGGTGMLREAEREIEAQRGTETGKEVQRGVERYQET